jgi:hypothetical protein
VSSPSEGLGTVPGRKGVGRESTVDKRKVSFVIGVHQVVVIGVDLNRSQLTLVNNVLVRQGAKIEPVLEPDGVRSPLSENIQLPLEKSVVKLLCVGDLGGVASAIELLQHNEGLTNERLAGLGGRAKEGRINGRLSPSQHPEPQRLGNVFQLPLRLLEGLLVRLEEKVAHGVLTERRKLEVIFTCKVLDKELVWN